MKEISFSIYTSALCIINGTLMIILCLHDFQEYSMLPVELLVHDITLILYSVISSSLPIRVARYEARKAKSIVLGESTFPFYRPATYFPVNNNTNTFLPPLIPLTHPAVLSNTPSYHHSHTLISPLTHPMLPLRHLLITTNTLHTFLSSHRLSPLSHPLIITY